MESKVIAITGASRGIGQNAAKYLASHGSKVILMARNEAKLQNVKDTIEAEGGNAAYRQVDVADPQSVKRAFAGIEEYFGPVDVLVNNAGSFNTIGPVWEVDNESWWYDFTVNVKGALLCAKAVLPRMMARQAGHIINVVGGGTKQAFPYGSAYGSSKTALARLSETMAEELKPFGIKVFAVDPGLNDTDMTRYQRETESGQKYLPNMSQLFADGVDEVPERAPEVIRTICSGQLDVLSGRILSVHDLELVSNNLEQVIEDDLYALRSNEI